MAKRGPKIGSIQEGSFASKVFNMKPGDVIAVPDEFDDGCGFPIKGASRFERELASLSNRSPSLAGRKFSTKRGMFVSGSIYVRQMLLIERHMDAIEQN